MKQSHASCRQLGESNGIVDGSYTLIHTIDPVSMFTLTRGKRGSNINFVTQTGPRK